MLPILPLAQGKLGERRAREIRAYEEDPRRAYFRLLHVLSVAIPNTKVLDEFEIPKDVPETTRKLMVEALDASLKKLKAIEQKLAELRRKLEVDEG